MNREEKFRSAPIAWGKTPLLFPLLAFIGGVGLSLYLGSPSSLLLLPAIGISLFLALVIYSLRTRFFKLQRLDLLFLLLATFLAGTWRSGESFLPNDAQFFAHSTSDDPLIGGEVMRLRPGERSIRAELNVTYLRTDSIGVPATGKLLVYLPPDIKTASVRVGDQLVLKGRIDTLRRPLNPGSFDSKAYWATQGVYHRMYLNDPANWRHIRVEKWAFVAKAEAVRRAWFKSFQQYLTGDELAVASALVMGKKDLLTDEVRSAYANTGALHVLAVSGLHVGIIFLILKGLFRLFPYRGRPWGRVLETSLTILAIWVFAFVSGFSPSVQRAAIMFTIIASGRLLSRQAYVINTLSGAALLMLWIEPGQLQQIGFQLSFLALVGIIWFANPLQRLIPGRGPVIGAVKGGVAASIGAQLGTLPVGLYVFRTFPVYFMLSGSAVVVFAYLAMCIGVAHGVFYAAFGFTFLTDATGYLLSLIVEMQNAFIYLFSGLPGGVFELRSFPIFSAVLLAGAIVALAAYVHYRRRLSLVIFLLLTTASTVWALSQVPGKGRAATLTVYHLRGQSLVDYHSEYASVAVGDEVGPTDLSFNVLPNRKSLGYDTVDLRPIDTLDTFEVGALKFTVLDGERKQQNLPVISTSGYVLIRNGFRPKALEGLELSTSLHLLVDGSNPPYLYDDWEEFAAERGLALWITGVKGAYVLVL